MTRPWLKLGATLLCCIAGHAAAVAQGQPPRRERNLTVYGDDPCPESRGDEIVVCGRRPEEERYRIPAPLRRGEDPEETSWSSRAAELEDAQRDSRPNSCSVVGSNGQTGCTQQWIREWQADRRARARQRR